MLAPEANADSITIITMASISSRMSTLITMLANLCCRNPRSSNALYIIVVELMANIPPRNMQSIRPQPKLCPTIIPSAIIQKTMAQVAIKGEEPIFKIFLKEKSSPRENSRNITPMSAHVCMSAMSTTDMIYGMLGLTKKPATTYPRTSGCFSRLKIMVTIPATTRISAKSFIRCGNSLMYKCLLRLFLIVVTCCQFANLHYRLHSFLHNLNAHKLVRTMEIHTSSKNVRAG